MTGPDDWVILVCPPGAETASIGHGTPKGRLTSASVCYRDNTPVP